MRLLPKTPRGTWLLAAAVWVGGVTAVWAVLPVRPRHSLELPEPVLFLGVGPGGRTILTAQRIDGPSTRESPGQRGPVHVRDAHTGRVLGAVLDVGDGIQTRRMSPDGRWCLVWAVRGGAKRSVVIDVAGRRAVPVPESNRSEFRIDPESDFSPDGRFLVASGRAPDGYRLVLWDLERGELRDAPRNARRPCAFSADGRFVALAAAPDDAEPRALHVYDTETFTRRATVPVRPTERVQHLRLSRDGSQVAASLTADDGRVRHVNDLDLFVTVRCWDVATGTERAECNDVCPTFLLSPDGRALVTPHVESAGLIYRWTDLATGSVRDGLVVGPADFLFHSCEVSPDGRVLAVEHNVWTAGPIEQLARRLKLNWPFEPSGTRSEVRFLDTSTGREIGALPVDLHRAHWSPDGRTVVEHVRPGWSTLRIWDVPPRKPVGRFAIGAAAAGLGIFGLARWRVQRLERASRDWEGEAPAEPAFLGRTARREPRPPNPYTPSERSEPLAGS
jgi:WD40 repeat protein